VRVRRLEGLKAREGQPYNLLTFQPSDHSWEIR
jgi:hypothetical protein